MKYLQLASVSTPAAVSTWFQDELVNRGVDAAYTFYVLSLLRGEPEDIDDFDDPYDNWGYQQPSQQNHQSTPTQRQQQSRQQSGALNPRNSEIRRRRAKRCAVECLKSAADSAGEGFESLVEELLARLEPTAPTDDDASEKEITRDQQVLPSTRSTTSSTTVTTTNTTAATVNAKSSKEAEVEDCEQLTADATSQSISTSTASHGTKKQTLAERAKRYFDAFPALQAKAAQVVDDSTPAASYQTSQADDNLLANESRRITQQKVQQQRKRNRKQRTEARGTELNSVAAPAAVEAPASRQQASRRTAKDFESRSNRTQLASAFSSQTRARQSVEEVPGNTDGTMSSLIHEEALMSSLTKKFDSRLAAIWADAPPPTEREVPENESVWKISLDLANCFGGDADVHDELASMSAVAGIDTSAPSVAEELVFSIPSANLGLFTTSVLDDENTLIVSHRSNGHHRHRLDHRTETGGLETRDDFDSNNNVSTENHSASGKAQRFKDHDNDETRRDEGDTKDSTEAGLLEEVPSTPALCLKNSTLNYDRQRTAFTEVIPNRKLSPASKSSATPWSSGATSSATADEGDCPEISQIQERVDDEEEDLLVSIKTHFTPIQSDPAEDEGRAPSSSLEELASYDLPPEPPIRHHKTAKQVTQPKQQMAPTAVVTSPPPVKGPVTAVRVDDTVKALWKMVDFEGPQPQAAASAAVDNDILGMAHCWRNDATTSNASNELKQEIFAEAEELLSNIFKDTSQGANEVHGSPSPDDGASLDIAALTAEELPEDDPTELFPVYLSGGVQYLSHFSSSANCDAFESPLDELAAVSTVRSIQDLQRQRRRRQQRKPCTFFLEGNCRRTDCKFSHDLSAITCRFWEDGSCFKGLACPFLHGYASYDEQDSEHPTPHGSSATGANSGASANKKEQRSRGSHGKFTIDSEQDFPSLSGGGATKGGYMKFKKYKELKKCGHLLTKSSTTASSSSGKKKKKKSSSSSSASSAESDKKIQAKDLGDKKQDSSHQETNGAKQASRTLLALLQGATTTPAKIHRHTGDSGSESG